MENFLWITKDRVVNLDMVSDCKINASGSVEIFVRGEVIEIAGDDAVSLIQYMHLNATKAFPTPKEVDQVLDALPAVPDEEQDPDDNVAPAR